MAATHSGWQHMTLAVWHNQDPKRTSRLGTKGLYIEPGSPWENGYCETSA
jgi:hypothetical protein